MTIHVSATHFLHVHEVSHMQELAHMIVMVHITDGTNTFRHNVGIKHYGNMHLWLGAVSVQVLVGTG